MKVPSVSSREYTDMSTDHRKPVVAFVCLAFIAAALVGVQRADAQAGRFLEAFVGSGARVHSATTLLTGDARRLEGSRRLAGLGFEVLADLSPAADPARMEEPGEPRTKRGRAGEVDRGASGKRPEMKADGSRHGRGPQRADRLENHVATAVRKARQAARDARGAASELARDARGPENGGAAARGLGSAVSEAARGLRNRPDWRGRRP